MPRARPNSRIAHAEHAPSFRLPPSASATFAPRMRCKKEVAKPASHIEGQTMAAWLEALPDRAIRRAPTGASIDSIAHASDIALCNLI